MNILPTTHTASQADGKTKLTTCGEVHINLTRGELSLSLQAVVVEELDCDVLGGMPFMQDNDIVLDLPKHKIVIGGKHEISYSPYRQRSSHSCRSVILRPTKRQVLFPGDYIEVPSHISDLNVAVEPRSTSISWVQPTVTKSVCGRVRIPNLTENIITINKHEHIAQMHFTTTGSKEPSNPASHITCANIPCSSSAPLENIKIDPDHQLSTSEIDSFLDLHRRYHQVFNNKIGSYNDASGRLRASINMGPVEPPPQKARLPSYNTEKMHLLQQKMDELESLGVLARPEDVGISVEHVS